MKFIRIGELIFNVGQLAGVQRLSRGDIRVTLVTGAAMTIDCVTAEKAQIVFEGLSCELVEPRDPARDGGGR